MRFAACLGVLVLVSGCSFPEPTVVDLEGTDSGTKSDAMSNDGTVKDGAVDGAKSDDGIDGSATETGDATVGDEGVTETSDGGPVTEAGDAQVDSRVDVGDAAMDTVPPCESGDFCDCDGDGDKKPGAGCGGTDCDDSDPRRNGKVTTFQSHDATGTSHGGDWDCSGTAEKEFGNGGFACSGILGGTSCTNAKGYTTAAASVKCGGMATIGGCKEELTLCVADPAKTQNNQIVKCK